MRIAVCDLGSFSALILIVDENLRALHEERLTVDLIYDPGTTEITRPGMSRAIRAMNRFRHLAAQHRLERAVVVTTAAIRDAANRVGVLHALNGHSPCRIRVLSRCAEGYLTAEGAVTGLGVEPTDALVIDVGGGSTEIVALPQVLRGFALGAARATQRWSEKLPSNRSARDDYLRECAHQAVSRLDTSLLPHRSTTIAVGGTITTLAAMKSGMKRFDPGRIHGMTLPSAWISREARRLASVDLPQLERLIPFDPTRARVLVAGTYLWSALLERLSVDRVTVSARGLRWGVAARLIGSGAPHTKALDHHCRKADIRFLTDGGVRHTSKH